MFQTQGKKGPGKKGWFMEESPERETREVGKSFQRKGGVADTTPGGKKKTGG